MKKTTVTASADIAFIKYWGKKDERLRLPENGSISMKVAGLTTTTTVEFDSSLSIDRIEIDKQSLDLEAKRVSQHLDRIRQLAKKKVFARVVSKNSFPKASGLSSSASGFAALTMATARAIGLDLTQKELSILTRQGSGSACRCVCGGYVEWHDGDSSTTSYAETIFPASHWDLRDEVVVVDENQKKISTTEGHNLAHTSPFFQVRQQLIEGKLNHLKLLLEEKDFTKFGRLIEAEALEFHSILLTSQPSLVAWYPGTVEVMLAVEALRARGVECYYTINTGFNIHVITLPKFEQRVVDQLKKLTLVKDIIKTKVGGRPKFSNKHLF